MNRTLRRLLWALLLSVGSYMATYFWYQSTRQMSVGSKDQQPIAFVTDISERVKRRPPSQQNWLTAEVGDSLYPGEAVQTKEASDVRIQLAESDRYIDLEAESLIVLSKSTDNEISLDLMDGSLFVGGHGGAEGETSSGPALTLKSDQGKVDLTRATAQLSKSKGSRLDLQVLKGSAKIEDSDGQAKEITSTQKLSEFEILQPQFDQTSFINPENPQPTIFKWKGAPANSLVQLWIGTSRKNLEYTFMTNEPSQSIIGHKLAVGKYFWKLVAIDKDSKKTLNESGVQKLEVGSKTAPAIVQPLANAVVIKENEDSSTEFKWVKPENVKTVIWEVAKDAQMQEIIISRNFTDQSVVTHQLPEGSYHWRLSAQYPGVEQPMTTKATPFRVAAPKPKVVISWLNPTETKPQFFVKDPKADLSWMSAQRDQVFKWKLKILPTADDKRIPAGVEGLEQETDKDRLIATLKFAGRYIATVEAFDDKDQLLATSDPKTFEVAPLPLLPAPKFVPEDGSLDSDNSGTLPLAWTKVDGAQEYWIQLLDTTGKEIRKARFKSLSTSLVNMLPGEYLVAIFAIDEHGRQSLKAPARKVKVPDESGLSAPKLKKIKVK